MWTIRNPFVLRMSAAERAEAGFERIDMRKGDVLGRLDEPLSHYVFIERGLVSSVRTMSDDRACKTGHIPSWGMVGISSFFLTDRSTADYVVVLPGEGLRVERERLRQIVSGNPQLTALFKRLAHTAAVIGSQTSACNGLHEFEHRLCRWLMIASKAIDADDIPMNQTEIARLLGVSRQQMTRAVQKLTVAGLLQSMPGQQWRIRLCDKAGIEANACECYRTIARRFENIFSNASRKNDFSMNNATDASQGAAPYGLRFR